MVRVPLQSDFSLNKIVFKNYIDKFWVPNIAENGWSFVLNIRNEAHRMRVPACCRRLGLAPARQSNLQTHAGERWSFVDFLLAPRKTRSFTVHGNCFKLSRILNTNVTLMHREALSSSESHSFASKRNKNFLCFKIATNEKACWIAHRMRVLACCRRLGLAPARQNNLQTNAGERWSFVDFLLAPRKTRSFTVHGNCFKLSRILNTNVTLMHREALSSSESHSFASKRNKNFLCFKIATNEKACWMSKYKR